MSAPDRLTALIDERPSHRVLIADIARTAHWLLNDSGYTKRMAARQLARTARQHNGGAFSDEELTALLEDAADLTSETNR